MCQQVSVLGTDSIAKNKIYNTIQDSKDQILW